jgi:divalent metal cation (Fe/Co/Zn/Cd) transporter
MPAYAGRCGLGAGRRGRYRRRLLGWSFLDLLAAALMGFMILRMGGELAWGAIKELIDTGLDDAQVEAIRQTLLATPGVRDLHELRTRRMAHQALVDTHAG